MASKDFVKARIWNSLAVELRAPDVSQAVFRNKLKNYLFDTTDWAHLRHHFTDALRLAKLRYTV